MSARKKKPAAPVVLWVPVRTKNPLNNREHWRVVSKRSKAVRFPVSMVVRTSFLWSGRPIVVLVTRVAPGKGLARHDALPGALKPVIDGVADGLGLDPNGLHDDDPRITWQHDQRRGRPRRRDGLVIVPAEWGVEITITERAP